MLLRPVHWPGLDGVRALAVAAVVAYHARPGLLPGGYLGVDVFFVLSGFLITSLLLREHRARGCVDVLGFWARRARRLLPALYVLLALVLAAEVALRLGGAAEVRWDALAALGYASNWFLVAHQQPYFASIAAPDPLQHLWSLGVEEQFYALWPLVCAAGLLRRRAALPAVLGGAAVSTALCALLYDPAGDPSRVYYGSDTHSAGLFIGAALAVLLGQCPPRPARSRTTARTARTRAVALGVTAAVTLAGLVAAGLLAGAFLRLDETRPLVYRGGFALVGLCTAVLVGALVHPAGAPLQRVLGSRPARWVGVRSYGIYLWHWPVLVLTSPHGDPAEVPLAVTALQVGASVVLAALSYRFVEAPVRSGSARRALRSAWSRGTPRRLAWVGVGSALAGSVGALALGVAAAGPVEPAAAQRVLAVHRTTLSAGAVGVTAVAPAVPPGGGGSADGPDGDATGGGTAPAAPGNSASPSPTPPEPPAAPPARVTAIGDSVMLGAANALAAAVPNLDVDAAVGRQIPAALDILRADRAAGRLGDAVIVHLGNNGFWTRGQFDEMMRILAGVPRVVVVNDKVPRPWQDANDALLEQAARDYPAVTVVDWRAAGSAHPELFWDDAIHLRPQGAPFYAHLVAAAVSPPASPATPDPGAAVPPPTQTPDPAAS